jgi:hypothetical protein
LLEIRLVASGNEWSVPAGLFYVTTQDFVVSGEELARLADERWARYLHGVEDFGFGGYLRMLGR